MIRSPWPWATPPHRQMHDGQPDAQVGTQVDRALCAPIAYRGSTYVAALHGRTAFETVGDDDSCQLTSLSTHTMGMHPCSVALTEHPPQYDVMWT